MLTWPGHSTSSGAVWQAIAVLFEAMSGEDRHREVLGKLRRDTDLEKLYFLPPRAEGGVNLLQKGTQLLQQAFPGLCTG